MSTTQRDRRFIRTLPGRVRISVSGLRKNPGLAEIILDRLAPVDGVWQVVPSCDTGRLLVIFDEKKITLAGILDAILAIEEWYLRSSYQSAENRSGQQVNETTTVLERLAGHAASAASSEFDKTNADMQNQLHNMYSNLPSAGPIAELSVLSGGTRRNPSANRSLASIAPGDRHPNLDSAGPTAVPAAWTGGTARLNLPLALSVGGFGILGVKQMISGSAALTSGSTAFNLAALVSAASGYPSLNKGLRRHRNVDLILGASALALALVRGNLVVLAGLSMLQYLKWKKSQVPQVQAHVPVPAPEINSYSERAGHTGLALAGATWAATGNPGIGLSVLLAGNPRVATLPAQYAWEQAELEAATHGYMVPEGATVAGLARLTTVVFADTSLIARSEPEWLRCESFGHDKAKLWEMAAALTKKSGHPWREHFRQQIALAGGKVRAAANLAVAEQGLSGEIYRHKTYLGTLRFLEQNGVNCDPFVLKIKRWERSGFQVECLARDAVCLGAFLRSPVRAHPEFSDAVRQFRYQGLQVSAIGNSLNVDQSSLRDAGIDTGWLGMDPAGVIERMAKSRRQGAEVLLITGEQDPYSKQLVETGVPAVGIGQLAELDQTRAYALHIGRTVRQHFRLARLWNIFGIMLAVSVPVSAPMINILSDAVTLIQLARSKRMSRISASPAGHAVSAVGPDKPSDHVLGVGEQHTDDEHGIAWHAMSNQGVLDSLEVDGERGLSPDRLAHLRRRFGANELAHKKPPSWLVSYLGQFKEFTTIVVFGTSLLALVSGDVFDGLAMAAILLANAAIGTAQERKAEKVIEALNQFQAPYCKVIRAGAHVEVSGSELVPGDLVCLEAGERVPADLRLLQAWNLELNEAALTGESLPVDKRPNQLAKDCTLAERRNMLFMGTDITRGKGIAVVVRTGMYTEIGRLMSLMKDQEKVATPLHQKVTDITKTFVKGAALAGGLVLLTGLLRGRPLTQMITTSVTMAASAVPEGLPVTITIALSAGIFRMAKQNALIRRLSALETLGRTTVICTDKTGTLTQNKMTVRKIASVGQQWRVSGNGYDPAGEIIPLDEAAATQEVITELEYLGRIGLLCNNSSLEFTGDQWQVCGDPTEGALLTMAAKVGLRPDNSGHWERVHEVPFDASSGTMSVVCRDSNRNRDKDCFVFCKGSVEAVLERCHWFQMQGDVLPLTDEVKKSILAHNDQFAREALRVLAFAYCPTEWLDGQPKVLDDELIYVGLAGMIDPPKPEVEKSIREAYALDVKPVMITGDHPVTALSIARELGLGDGETRVTTGQELDSLTERELVALVEHVAIFARVTPEHKLRIVKAFQQRGHIVAMTGDGINDTPAIKQSNVGIAMGRTGTEVTKGTADMVLKKDHFGSILEGVKEGRTIIGNIRKAIGCLLTGNLAEILVTATAVVAGMPVPLVPIQILLMNLLTDAVPAMILAVDPAGKSKQTARQDIVDQDLYRKVVSRGILLGAGSLAVFGAALATGAPLVVAQTAAFTTLVVGQLAQTLAWRQENSSAGMLESLRDRYLVGGLGVSFLALLASIYVPALARFFRTAPVPPQYWVAIAAVAGAVSLLSKSVLSLISGKTHLQLQSGLPGLAQAG